MGVMRWQKEPSKSMEHLIPVNMLSSLYFSLSFLFFVFFFCLFFCLFFLLFS